MDKPFSPPCERNAAPILSILTDVLQSQRNVLEIGSGTGQHAVYFGSRLPHLRWQTSDFPDNHPGICAWLIESGLANVMPPVPLDMEAPQWPEDQFDTVFTANTCHIMSWPQVQKMVSGVAALLPSGGIFCLYGPFNYGGTFTSEGNALFDAALKSQLPYRGIRDIEALQALAAGHGLQLEADHAMPANNRLLVFRRLTNAGSAVCS